VSQYEAELARNHALIELLRTDNAELIAQIEKMKTSAKTRAAEGNAPRAAIGQHRSNVSSGPPAIRKIYTEASSDDAGTSDQVSISPKLVVSKSGANDRVVIFAAASGRSRSYRPPQGMMAKVAAGVDWNRVTITAIGPRAAQLAIYDAENDRWAIQDLRGETAGTKAIWFNPQRSLQLIPYTFEGPRLTQIVVFDVGRFKWSVQELDEPWEEGSAAAFIRESVAVYVLGRHLYAYSSEAGRWDTLTMEQPVAPPRNEFPAELSVGSALTIDNDVAAVSQRGRLHVFTAKTGRWQTVEPKD
jgi:hypothetical protein